MKESVANQMISNDHEIRNFLFFLSDIHPLNLEDTLIGALAVDSSWGVVAEEVSKARREDAFVRSLEKLSLYIHVPFCSRICTFCHCPKVLLRRHSEIDDYIKVLLRQMMYFSSVYQGMDASSLCFGGGTPSILNEKEMATILDGVDQSFPASTRQIYMEIHPTSWTASKLAVLSGRGLYRASIGIQSFDEKVLKDVARSQTKKQVLWCLRSARKAAVPRLNVDLIAGLPGQTFKGFMSDLKLVIKEGVNEIHLQPYTSFAKEELSKAGGTFPEFLQRRDAMMTAGEELVLASGFRCKGLGGYLRDDKEAIRPEWEYLLPKRAFAAFGPFAMGEFPGAVFYRAGTSDPANELPTVKVAAQNSGYAMSQYALLAAINGLGEDVFFKYFGVALDKHCGAGLRYLQRYGLLAFAKGKWKFPGKWEFRRVREYAALSRVLFGNEILSRLKTKFRQRYNPHHDYENNETSFFKAFTQNWLMTLYYQKRV